MTLASENYAPKGQALPKPAKLTQVVNSVTFSVGLYIAIVGTIIYGSYLGAQSMGYNWQWYRMPQYFYTFTDDGFQLGEFMIGLGKTIQATRTRVGVRGVRVDAGGLLVNGRSVKLFGVNRHDHSQRNGKTVSPGFCGLPSELDTIDVGNHEPTIIMHRFYSSSWAAERGNDDWRPVLL